MHKELDNGMVYTIIEEILGFCFSALWSSSVHIWSEFEAIDL